jgi:hypothetical protein
MALGGALQASAEIAGVSTCNVKAHRFILKQIADPQVASTSQIAIPREVGNECKCWYGGDSGGVSAGGGGGFRNNPPVR